MSDWISRQLDDVAAKREQADKELAERRAKFKAEWEAAWVAEAPIRQRAQATADRLVADAHRLLLSGKMAPKELAFTLYIHFRRVRPTAWERVHDVTTEPINLGRAWPIVGNGYYMGLWIDEEGKLRSGALEHRTVQGWLEDELPRRK